MGAPLGNQNAAKAKRWAAAIERAITRRAEQSGRDFMRELDELADRFVQDVLMCNKDALPGWKEMGDRLEGKPPQQTILTGEDGGPVGIQVISGVPRADG